MSTPTRPSTPIAQSTPSTPQTGTWRHPKLDEIVRRQNASSFSEKNIKKILYNAGGIIVVYFIARSLWRSFPKFFLAAQADLPYSTYGYYALQTMFIYNILYACLPLFKTTDDLSDIALTPAQRKLLGLPQSSTPPTPGSQYVTPPRYARTPTPLSGSPGGKGGYQSLSTKGSPTGSILGSPFSPGASPLLQKAMGGGINGTRRHSYGSPSPLGQQSRTGSQDPPGTPTPSMKGGANIGLNNRWRYEQARRNSGSSKLYP